MLAVVIFALILLAAKTAPWSRWRVQIIWVPRAAALAAQVDARRILTQATAGVRLVGDKLAVPPTHTPMVVRHHAGAKRLDGETRRPHGEVPHRSTLETRHPLWVKHGHRIRTRKTSQKPHAGMGPHDHPTIRRSRRNDLQVTRHHGVVGSRTTG